MIAHLEHLAAPGAGRFHDDADEILRHVDHQPLQRLEFLAVFRADHNFRLTHHQLKTFAPHRLDQNRELQFAAPQHAERFRCVRVFHADGDVGQQFFLQAITEVARSEKRSLFAGKRAAVHGKNHRQRGLVDQQRFQRHGVRQIRDAFADLDAFNAGNRHEIASRDRLCFIAFQASKRIQLGDARRRQLAVQLADAHVRAALQRTVKNAPNRNSSQEFAVIQVHYLNLQNAIGIARRRGNVLDDGLE